jgi:hypothetical protein
MATDLLGEEDGPEVDVVARDEAPCVRHMCTIGADFGMECACNACRDHVIQSRKCRIEDYLSEVEGPNAHPVGLETVDYLLNWSATHCAAGHRSLWASMPFAKVSYRPLSSCPYQPVGGEDSRTPF